MKMIICNGKVNYLLYNIAIIWQYDNNKLEEWIGNQTIQYIFNKN